LQFAMLKRWILLLSILAAVLPPAPLPAEDFEVMTVLEEVGLREKPGLIYKRIGRLVPGEEVIVDEREGDWAHVAHMGWVPAAVLQAADARPEGAAVYEVVVDRARLRGGPGTGNPVVGNISRGDRLEALEEKDGWLLIAEGKWIFGELVRPVEEEAPSPPRDRPAAPQAAPEPAARSVKIARPRVNLRAGPSTSEAAVGSLKAGDVRQVEEEREGWLRLAGGGWVRGDLVEEAGTQAGPAATGPGHPGRVLRQWGLLSILGVYIKLVEVPENNAIATRIRATLDNLTRQKRDYTFMSILLDVPAGTAYRFNYSPAYNRIQITDRRGRRFGNFVHKEGDIRKLPAGVRILFEPAAVFPGDIHTGLLAFSGELDAGQIESVEIYMSGRMHPLYEEQ